MVEDPLLFSDSSFFGLTMYSYNLATTIVLLAILRIIHGVTWAVSTTAVGTAITDIIPDSRRGEGMGWYGMAMTIAMAIGPMIGLSVVKKLFISWPFLISHSFILYGSLIIVNDENAIHTTKRKRENAIV
ncbi:MFS transporter [Bacillus cereus]